MTTEAKIPKIQPGREDFDIAAQRMALSPWLALPHGLLDRDREVRQLSDAGYRALMRLLDAQWGHGSIPNDPGAAARLIGSPLPATREAMALFTQDAIGELVHRQLASERTNSLERIAISVAKGRRGAGVRWTEDSPANTPAISSATTPTSSSGNSTLHNTYVVESPVPAEGVEVRGKAVEAAARAAVLSGLVVTPLVFGMKVPPAMKSQVWIRTLEEFESYWPGDCNAGYRPGQSGFLEVDIDNAEGEALAQSLGCFAEPTFTVQTPRALAPEGHPKKFPPAVRLRFQMPPGFTFGKHTLDGVLEVFGTSGFVVLPPSWISEYGAGYTVLDDAPPLPCPPRLAEALQQAGTPSRRTTRTGQRNAAAFLAALKRVTKARIPTGRKKFTTRCPAHDDHTPSLAVGLGADGEPVFTCHSGCTPASVLAALGLSWADFYERSA